MIFAFFVDSAEEVKELPFFATLQWEDVHEKKVRAQRQREHLKSVLHVCVCVRERERRCVCVGMYFLCDALACKPCIM